MNPNNKNASSQISREAITQTPLLSAWERWNISGKGYIKPRSRTRLEFELPSRVTVRRNKIGWMFVYWFLGLGVAILVGALYFLLRVDNSYDSFELYVLIFISIFLLIDGVRYFFKKSPSFDKKLGWMWLGKPDATSILELQEVKKRRLNKIVAIQMIETKGWQLRKLYELNVVFDDLQRMNIQCHGQMSEMSNNGKQLAKFLEVPFY